MQNHRQAIQLHTACNIGSYTTAKLLRYFGSIEHVFLADENTIAKLLSAKQFQAFKNNSFNIDAYLKKHERFLAEDPKNHHFITWDDPRYPQTLKHTDDAPVFLYIKGNLDVLTQPAIAIVGSRNADEQGLMHTHQFATELAKQGFCIVSGFAQGVDGMAHLAALEAGQATIAILGAGLDVDYPKAHRDLRQAFVPKNTCIISEFLLDAQPLEYHFPRRNRTIAALSAGVLVTQAELKSGSLITARLANELGRDVFAIPYGLTQNGQGCNHLIQQGAKLVLSSKCITEEYYYILQSYAFSSLNLQEKNLIQGVNHNYNHNHTQYKAENFLAVNPNPNASNNFQAQNQIQSYILKSLTTGARHFDELLQNAQFQLSHEDLQTEFFMLELEQVIERREGGFYYLI